jgi:hypothetical protein
LSKPIAERASATGLPNSVDKPSINDHAVNDHAVLGLCEILALMFGLPPGEALFRGEPLSLRLVGFIVAGAVFAALGPGWPAVRKNFPQQTLVVSLGRVASDARYWLAIILVGFLYAASPEMYRRATTPAALPPTVSSEPTLEDIAKELNTSREQGAVVANQLGAAILERDALKGQLAETKRQLDAARADLARSSKQVSRPQVVPSELTDGLRRITWSENLGPCRTNGLVHICGLTITGTSNATSNIRFKSAQFTGINGDVADLKIDLGPEGKVPATEAKIPPGASFTLWLEINPYLDVYAFMAKWGRVYFNAEYEGTKFSRSFDEDRMREMLGPASFNPRPSRDKNGN